MKTSEELHKCYNPIVRVVNFWVEVGVAKNEEKKKAVKNKLTSYILLFSITAPVFIKLVYNPNFGTWILLFWPFGPFGQLKVVRKKLFSSYFWGWFLWAKYFSYCPELPKWPKQKNSCSKIWLIDQLYIKLGYRRAREGDFESGKRSLLIPKSCKSLLKGNSNWIVWEG